MAESDVHIDCLFYLRSALRSHYERSGRNDVYVAANLFVYYERGNPRAVVVAPDVFAVLGAPSALQGTPSRCRPSCSCTWRVSSQPSSWSATT